MEPLKILLEDLDRQPATVEVKVPLSALPRDGLERARRLADMAAAIVHCLRGSRPEVNFTVDSGGAINIFVGEMMRVRIARAAIRKKFAYLTIYL